MPDTAPENRINEFSERARQLAGAAGDAPLPDMHGYTLTDRLAAAREAQATAAPVSSQDISYQAARIVRSESRADRRGPNQRGEDARNKRGVLIAAGVLAVLGAAHWGPQAVDSLHIGHPGITSQLEHHTEGK
jgi:hypothetical protein